MPHTQQQYQIRLQVGVPGGVDADLVLWADATGVHAPPVPVHQAVSLRNRSAIAAWVRDEQATRGQRTSVLVLVAPADEPGELPVAHLAVAGALVEALSDLGLDHTSPEAAYALAGWLGIRAARTHLLGATAHVRALKHDNRAEELVGVFELDAESDPNG